MSDSVANPRIIPNASTSQRGQSLLEFAFVLPIMLMLVGGIVQFGAIYAANHSLIQIGRDIGRWAATQPYPVCSDAATDTPAQPVTEADRLAIQAELFGYGPGDWGPAPTTFIAYADNTALPASAPFSEGVEVVWSYGVAEPCPPLDSSTAAFVTIRLSHRIPVILPGFGYLPGFGTCDANGCYFAATTRTQFRMEPAPAP